jgi:hypothetical protein
VGPLLDTETMTQEERAAHLRKWMRGAIAKHLNEDHADDLLAREVTEIPQKRQDQVALHRDLHPEFADAEVTGGRARKAHGGSAEASAAYPEGSGREDPEVPEVLNGVGPKTEADHEADAAAAQVPRRRSASGASRAAAKTASQKAPAGTEETLPAKPARPAAKAAKAAATGTAGTKTRKAEAVAPVKETGIRAYLTKEITPAVAGHIAYVERECPELGKLSDRERLLFFLSAKTYKYFHASDLGTSALGTARKS